MTLIGEKKEDPDQSVHPQFNHREQKAKKSSNSAFSLNYNMVHNLRSNFTDIKLNWTFLASQNPNVQQELPFATLPPHVISSSGFPHIFCPQIRRKLTTFSFTRGSKNWGAGTITHYRDLVWPRQYIVCGTTTNIGST